MNNKIKTILMAAIMSSVVLTQGVCVSAAQFDDGASAFSDGTGSVSALASTLAKQTEEQTQEFVAKEEEAAQIREERRVEKAEKASEKAEQEKTAVLESIQQTVEDTKKKIAEEAEAKRLAKRQEVVNFALQFEGNPYVYGGTSLTNGADCSGFVMSVFANFGYSLPRVAAAQCDASTKKDISQLEPGDLVFYGNGYIDHVALYIGDGKIIHASNAATGIKISSHSPSKIFLNPRMVSFNGTYWPFIPVNCSATEKLWDRNLCTLRALDTVSLSSSESSSIPMIAMISCSSL